MKQERFLFINYKHFLEAGNMDFAEGINTTNLT